MRNMAWHMAMLLSPPHRPFDDNPCTADARQTPDRAEGPDMPHNAFNRLLKIDDTFLQFEFFPIAPFTLRLGLFPKLDKLTGDSSCQPFGGHLNFEIKAFVAFVRPQRKFGYPHFMIDRDLKLAFLDKSHKC
jgi:hypothetical protein